MEISKSLLYFFTFIALSCGDYAEFLHCSEETPCQPGFLCSAEHVCKPIDKFHSPFPTPHSQVKDVSFREIPSPRIVRKVKHHNADKDREMLMQMGTEGIADLNNRRKPTLKDGHRKHKHRPHMHKKERISRSDVSMFEDNTFQNHENEITNGLSKEGIGAPRHLSDEMKMLTLNPIGNWEDRNNVDSESSNHLRAKRSTHSTSQWQKALDLLNQGKVGGATQQNSDTTKQLDILEEIKQRLEKEVERERVAQHGHHKPHLSEVDSKKEEIKVLNGIEDLLEHNDKDVNSAHNNEHHHKHGQTSSLTSDIGDISTHSHDSHSRTQSVKTDLEGLEKLVLGDIVKAESNGVTQSQGAQLKDEVKGLEVLEKQAVEDLIKNGDSQTSLSELEKKVELWGVLEQLIGKLKTEFPNTQQSREERSTSVDNTKSISLLSLLQHALNNLQANSHQKQTSSLAATTASPSKPLTPVSADSDGQNVEEEQEMGRVNQDHCDRCEPLVGEEVCGGNGKTYVSLCHAVNCAGLRESDITAGRCIEEDDCSSNKCSEREECVPMLHGTCLTLYSKDGLKQVPCRRYTCVAKEECGNDVEHEEICGEDGKTYPSLCYLHKAGIALAYTGSCRPYHCQGAVCARDGLTYESSCHARAHGVRVDYNGECFTEDKYSKLVNCATVRDAGRCAQLQCSDPVVPAEACCPVCGGAVVVDPDSAALSELVASWEEVNHLYIVENFLRHLLSNNEALKCELTATLTNTGSFSVVLSAANPKDHTICRNAGRNLVQTINHKSDSTQDAMLHPMAMKAALINPFNPDSLIKGYLIRSQQTMMTKASDLKNKAASSANEALVDLDEEVQNKKYEQSVEGGVNKASGGSSLLTLWTFVCAVLCMVLL